MGAGELAHQLDGLAVQLERKAEYPPIEDYIDGVVKGDDAQVAEYRAKCLEVKKRHPLP